MKAFVILPNPLKDKDLSVSRAVVDRLIACGARVYAEASMASRLPGCEPYTTFPSDAELLLVIGGDGSVIDASVLAVQKQIPLLGINLGKIGYLSEVDPQELSVLRQLIDDQYTTTEQMLLTVSCVIAGEQVTCDRMALNDIIVSHSSASGIAEFTVSDSSEDTVRYRADGLIVATPAGSTAYSLSAGGPVVAHNVPALTVTPVCAHSLFQRSIIYSSKERIAIRNVGSTDLQVLVDGRPYLSLPPESVCYVEVADTPLRMLKLSHTGVFSTLFRKIRTIETL